MAQLSRQDWEIFGYFLSQCSPKTVQGIQGGLFIHGGIDCLQVGHEGFKVFVGHILAGIAELVNDTVLDLGLGKYRMDGCVKSGALPNFV